MSKVTHEQARDIAASTLSNMPSWKRDLDLYIDQQEQSEREAAELRKRPPKELWDELCEQVAQMCEYLGSNRSEVPCDSWHLRDLVVKLRAELQAKGEALAEVLNDALLCLEAVPDDKFCSVRVRDAKARIRAAYKPVKPTAASQANRIQLKDPTPSPMPAGGSPLLDQQSTSDSPAKLGGTVDAFREELVEALRACDASCCGSLGAVADRLERK